MEMDKDRKDAYKEYASNTMTDMQPNLMEFLGMS